MVVLGIVITFWTKLSIAVVKEPYLCLQAAYESSWPTDSAAETSTTSSSNSSCEKMPSAKRRLDFESPTKVFIKVILSEVLKCMIAVVSVFVVHKLFIA